MQPSVRSEARAVGAGALVYGALFLDRLAPLYLIVVMRGEEGLAPTQLAMVPLAIGLGWAVAMAFSRWLSGRLTDRARITLGVAGVAVMHVVSVLAGGWLAFVLFRFLGSIFAGSVAPPVTGLVFTWAPQRRRGLDIGIVFSSTRLFGSLLAPIIVLGLAVRANWRAALLASALALLVVSGVFRLLAPAAAHEKLGTADRRRQAQTVLDSHGRRNIALATVFGILTAGWLTVISQTGPSVVVNSLGVTADRAGAIVGTFGVGSWLAALFVPMSSDRLGRRLAVGVSTGIGGASGVALAIVLGSGAPPTWAPSVLFALGGVALGALPLALSVIPGEAVLRGDPGRAVVWPVFGAEVVGAAILPALALLGFLPERATLGVAGGALLVGALLSLAFARPAREVQTATPRVVERHP